MSDDDTELEFLYILTDPSHMNCGVVCDPEDPDVRFVGITVPEIDVAIGFPVEWWNTFKTVIDGFIAGEDMTGTRQ